MFKKKIRKIIFKLLTAIKLKIFQRSSTTTLRYNPMGDEGCLSYVDKKQDITISPMFVKTITKTGKNKNSVEKCEKKVSKLIKPLAFP